MAAHHHFSKYPSIIFLCWLITNMTTMRLTENLNNNFRGEFNMWLKYTNSMPHVCVYECRVITQNCNRFNPSIKLSIKMYYSFLAGWISDHVLTVFRKRSKLRRGFLLLYVRYEWRILCENDIRNTCFILRLIPFYSWLNESSQSVLNPVCLCVREYLCAYPYQIQMLWHFDEFALSNTLYYFSHACAEK